MPSVLKVRPSTAPENVVVVLLRFRVTLATSVADVVVKFLTVFNVILPDVVPCLALVVLVLVWTVDSLVVWPCLTFVRTLACLAFLLIMCLVLPIRVLNCLPTFVILVLPVSTVQLCMPVRLRL